MHSRNNPSCSYTLILPLAGAEFEEGNTPSVRPLIGRSYALG